MIYVNVTKLIRRFDITLGFSNIGFIFNDKKDQNNRMKVFFTILTMCFVLVSCSKEESTNLESGQFKGKLVLKGICMNYVIQVVDGDLDASLYEKQWVHPIEQQTFSNVFALESVCSFPKTIEQGDEFIFALADDPENCAVCLAYSPTPNKRISIKVYD